MNTWQKATLGDIGEWGSGGTPLSSISEYYNGPIPWLVIEDLNDGVVTSSRSSITKLGLDYSSTKMVEPGTLLIAMYGSIGKLGIAGIPCATNQAIAFCKCFTNLVDVNFVFYYLLQCREELTLVGKGGTQQNISQAVLKEFPILLPPLPEQECIAAILSKADRLRRLRRYALELSDSFLQSVFVEMFGDPATNPMGWDVVAVDGVLADSKKGVQTGPFGSALKRHEYVKRGIPVWGINNVSENEFVEAKPLYITPSKYSELTNYTVEEGDILISRAGTVGRMCVARPSQYPSIIGTNLVRARLDTLMIQPDYFSVLFTYFANRVGSLRTSSDEGAYSFMNPGILKAVKIPRPPLHLQEQFAGHVRRLQRLRARQREAVRQAEHLFQTLLHKAFRGELSDREDVASGLEEEAHNRD